MLYDDYNYNTGEDLNVCGICNKHFVEGEKVATIEMEKGPYRLVCQNCNKKSAVQVLLNKKTRQKQSTDTQLSEQDKLWRYMDLAKFVCMLKNGSLFFSAPRNFEDIYEGAHGELRNKKAWDDFYLSFFRTAIVTAPDNCWHCIESEKVEKQAKELLAQISEKYDKDVFICCWYQNDYESEAMWKLYSSNVSDAIAIQTSFKRLNAQVGDVAEIHPIKYIDYAKRFVDINHIYWYKRKSFEYEKEVRALIRDHSMLGKDGIEIKVNLDEMVEKIYVSPYAPRWFFELVQDIVKKYGYSFGIEYSILCEKPF